MASKSEENYHDFKKKSENRNFKLIVEDKVLFIDLYVMSTFKKIYSGENYKENQNKKISIADAKFDDIHQMLQCLGPRPQRPITGKLLFSFSLCFSYECCNSWQCWCVVLSTWLLKLGARREQNQVKCA